MRERILLTCRSFLNTPPPSRLPIMSVFPSTVSTSPFLSGEESAKPMCENVKTTMSPASMSPPCGFFVCVLLSCAKLQFSKPHALAVVGRLNVAVSRTLADFIASRTTQQTKAAHHGHDCFGSRFVAALYSFTRGPQFVPLISSTPISPFAMRQISSRSFVMAAV